VPYATLWPPGTRLPYAGLAASAAVVAAWGTCRLLTPRTAVLPADYERPTFEVLQCRSGTQMFQFCACLITRQAPLIVVIPDGLDTREAESWLPHQPRRPDGRRGRTLTSSGRNCVVGMELIGRRLSRDELRAVSDAPSKVDALLHGDLHDDDAEMPDPELDLGKSWHAIHYLLTGTGWEIGEGAAGAAILGGDEIGEDGGYGPARVLDPESVRATAAARRDGCRDAARPVRPERDGGHPDLPGHLGRRSR
jgi:hypothetical protein